MNTNRPMNHYSPVSSATRRNTTTIGPTISGGQNRGPASTSSALHYSMMNSSNSTTTPSQMRNNDNVPPLSFMSNNVSAGGTNTSMLTPRSDILSGVDFKAIDDMDPSLSDGHILFFDKEVPVELRAQDGPESGEQSPDVGTLEAIRVKILTMGGENQLHDVRVELTSESDLFFHYTHSCDRENYGSMKQNQDLMVDYYGYPKVLAKMLMSCMKDPESFLCIFVMGRDGNGQLTFVQNMEYKFVELLTMDFMESQEHVVRQHISFRYNSLRSRLSIMHSRLQDVNALVKLKNPSLLLQIQRSSQNSSTPQPSLSPRSTHQTLYTTTSIKRNR